MFKRSKSKLSQRTRAASPEDAGSDTPAEPITVDEDLAYSTPNSRLKSRLSFGAEEEEDSGGEVFKLKKSKLSRNLSLGKHPANILDNLDQASISPSRNGPTYDEAYLNELKKSTPSSRAPVPRRVVDLAEEFQASVSEVDQGTLKLQIFFKAVIMCFTNAVSDTESLLLAKFTSTAGSRSASAFDPEALPARTRFLARQVKLVTNLMRWRRCTGELFGPKKSRQLPMVSWLIRILSTGDPNDEDGELGPEGDLVSLSKIVEYGALDVYSSSHIRRVVDLAEEFQASVSEVDQGTRKLQIFFKAVIMCFTNAVSDTESLTCEIHLDGGSRSASAFDPEAIPARTRFLARQVKLVTNLMRWRRCTGELFGVGQLITRIVDGCMLDVADNGWDVGGEEALKKVSLIVTSASTVCSLLPDYCYTASRIDNVWD
ncbi:hypothetical protein BT96DRAFT_999053 [Gymnopus androsaceus JB14]|uniref:Uncharacterized protein n=1 Tax=Gymnopus androsaceus JB14 TaxID=1447944 RepID=A0A6A4H9L6_9AGAR|nr:hypothetical protein BT96DRAFT_999053 [Gymnopus androsaceus JB14]